MSQLALIQQIDVAALIDSAGPGNIEDSTEGGSRNRLLTRSKHSVQREAAPRGADKELVELVAIRVRRNAVARGGVVELPKEKLILPMGIVEGSGKQQLQAIF